MTVEITKFLRRRLEGLDSGPMIVTVIPVAACGVGRRSVRSNGDPSLPVRTKRRHCRAGGEPAGRRGSCRRSALRIFDRLVLPYRRHCRSLRALARFPVPPRRRGREPTAQLVCICRGPIRRHERKSVFLRTSGHVGSSCRGRAYRRPLRTPRDCHPYVSPLRHRRCRKPHSRLWLTHSDTGETVLRRRDSHAGNLPCTYGLGGAAPISHRRFYPRNCCIVQSSEASHTVIQRPPLLQKEVRCEKDPRSLL